MRAAAVAGLALGLMACSHVAPLADPDERASLTALTLQYADAFGRNDAAALDRLRLQEFVFITSTGRVIPKHVELADIRNGMAKAESALLSEVDVRMHGETALVTARARLRGEWHGRRYDGDYRLGMIWVRTRGGWRLLAEQASRLAE